MGSVSRLLFGGTSQKSQSSSQPVDVQSPEMRALRPDLAGQFRNLFGTPDNPLAGIPAGPSLPKEATTMTDSEGVLLRRLADLAGGAGGDLIRRTVAGDFLPGRTSANPFVEAAIKQAQRPTLQGLEETLSRTLPGRFTQAGQFIQPKGSSAFDRAAAIATRGAADALSGIATNISSQAFENERTRQTQAIQLGQQEVQALINNLQAQALPRLIAQIGPEVAQSQFNQQLNALLQVLQMVTAASAPAVGQVASSTASGTSEKGAFPGLFPKGLQGG